MAVLRFLGEIFRGLLFVLFAVVLYPLHLINRQLCERPRYPVVYEDYYDRLNIYGGRETWEASCEGVPRNAVLLYSLHWAHLEIKNGGFWQFFYNSTGVLAPEARDGFAAIGMSDVAAVIQRAMDKVGQPYPFDRERRMGIVGEPDDRMDFDAEDDVFYRLAGNPKMLGGAPRYYERANAYAEESP